MADYFDERGIPNSSPTPEAHAIDYLRFLADYDLGPIQIPVSAPPASKTAVEALLEVEIRKHGNECVICKSEYEVGDFTKIMPCGHFFHTKCLQLWLEKKNSCPICRHELPTDDEAYEAYRREKIREKQRVHDIDHLHNSMFT